MHLQTGQEVKGLLEHQTTEGHAIRARHRRGQALVVADQTPEAGLLGRRALGIQGRARSTKPCFAS